MCPTEGSDARTIQPQHQVGGVTIFLGMYLVILAAEAAAGRAFCPANAHLPRHRPQSLGVLAATVQMCRYPAPHYRSCALIDSMQDALVRQVTSLATVS